MREYEDIAVSRPSDGVLLVTLNRPDKLNALTFPMFDELRTLCYDVESEPDVRVVVLTGAGRGFCAGMDLDSVASLSSMSAQEFMRRQELWAGTSIALARLNTPVIAAVNGPAAGAGLSLAAACDIRIVSTTARFNAAFIRVGLTGGDMGSSWLLPRLVGLGLANELLFTGRPVDAEEAVRIGLANSVVAPEELLPSAYRLADAIIANSPFGVRLTKQVVQANMAAASLEIATALENRGQALAMQTRDADEAVAAFREKRSPNFTGN